MTKQVTEVPVQLPALSLSSWRPTRDTLQQVARIVGKVRSQFAPKSKHWWHITLSVYSHGLTTTPFPVGTQNYELSLDLAGHRLILSCSDGRLSILPLAGQSSASLFRWIISSLPSMGIDLERHLSGEYGDESVLPYDYAAAENYRRTINWVDSVFKAFKGGLREESSPVQLFPHHFDLALNWFSGRLVPGADPADEEHADEQMNFGFVTGDESIPDAYFYVTAYPEPADWMELELKQGAYWHTDGWIGAVLPYAELLKHDQPYSLLLVYLQQLRLHGAGLMA
ncbi:MAG: DUF5996 family protein [Candidatus Thiodiazotropha endolucinida]